MVLVSRALLVRQYGRFMDDLRIYVKGGTGGMGHARLGGIGGKGGDVWLVADNKMTLKKIKNKYPKKRFVAGAGASSSLAELKGNKGEDCEINVPPGISVTTDDGKHLGELNKAGERLLVAHGGIGGCPVTDFFPCKGQVHMIHLDLKLIADVGLIGFPNAGKSSLLSRISHAKPQIADYAFTTITPEIGTVTYSDHKQIQFACTVPIHEHRKYCIWRSETWTAKVLRTSRDKTGIDQQISSSPKSTVLSVTLQASGSEALKLLGNDFVLQITVADLPGLIEGAHVNKGRGHKFLKHVERTKQLLFVIDVSGFQLSSQTPFRTAFETIMLLTKELELYKEELRTKSALLAVNKMDLPNAKEKLNEFMEQLQRPQDYSSLLPQKMIPEVIVKFKEIIPLSAHTGEGTEDLINCLRKAIDEEADEKIENYQRNQLCALHQSEI